MGGDKSVLAGSEQKSVELKFNRITKLKVHKHKMPYYAFENKKIQKTLTYQEKEIKKI